MNASKRSDTCLSERVRFGVLGARSMVATSAVMPALETSDRCELVAVASAGGPVPVEWSGHDVGSYDDVLEHPDVEAVYIPLPNGLHEHWVGRAAAAGKHVLCEKPLAPDANTARRMAASCERAGVLLAEAWMTPFDPRWAAALQLAHSGQLGDVNAIEATFTFAIGADAADNYRWDPNQGGGALLDVGVYCLGPAVELWGSSPQHVEVTRSMSITGVDAATSCRLAWPDGRTASIQCSFVAEQCQRLVITGSKATAVLDGDAHTGGSAAREIQLTSAGMTAPAAMSVEPGDPYVGMIDAFANAVRHIEPWPRSVGRSIELLELLDRIAEIKPPAARTAR